MSDDELGLLERLRSVHSMVPSHEGLFREAAERIAELEVKVSWLEGQIGLERQEAKQLRRSLDGAHQMIDELLDKPDD